MRIDAEKIELYDVLSNESLEIRNVEFVTRHDFLIIYPHDILSRYTKYTVKIPFKGLLDDDILHGYYRSSYYDRINKRRV